MKSVLERYKLLFNPKTMNIHKKFTIFLFLISSFMYILLGILTHTIVLGSYEEREQQDMNKQIERVVKFLGHELYELDLIGREYAMRDDTYNFLYDKNQDYIDRSIADNFFVYSRLNIFILIDTEGNVVFKKAFDLEEKIEVPISENLLRYIAKHQSLFDSSEKSDGIVGFITLQDEHMIVSVSPILARHFQGSSHGILIVGRHIDENKLALLSEQTQLSISFADDREKHQSLKQISISSTLFKRKLHAWIGSGDKKYIDGYISINDMKEKSDLMLKVKTQRKIYSQGRTTIFYFIFVTVFLSIIFLTSVWFFMNRVIFNRLNILMLGLHKMGKYSDASRVSLLSKDEFSALEDEFHNMIEAIEISQKQIIHQAQHDILTNLPNRRYFYEQAEALLRKAHDENRIAAVLFIDLDHFKSINDSFAHRVGDLLLQAAAKRLKTVAPEESILSRLGGDEFLVFLSEIESVVEAEAIAKQIIKSFSKPFKIDDRQLVITASIGMSIYPLDGADLEVLINNADIAMYKVKKETKNNYKLYKSDMRNRLSGDMLRKALERDELMVYYQPQINGCTQKIEGMEALLRWKHPKLGMISPFEFIPLAEETGLIVLIGEWVLREACLQNKKWQNAGYKNICVSVNISSIQLMRQDFMESVKGILDETNLETSYLELEITESIALHKADAVIFKLQKLRDMGIRITIDDFGTGYSSLSYLERFPIDCLKIDKMFMNNIVHNPTIPKVIIGMAKSLGISVIAEGVETKEQLEEVTKLGCLIIQGYLFSEPLPVDKLGELLRENK